MATKVFLCITLLAFLFNASAENASESEFFNNFRGSRKGDNIEGISKLKKYLQDFGYINSDPSNTNITSNGFDDLLESAQKKYQSYYHLDVTGILDNNTVSLMSQPRCGVPDFPAERPDYTFFPGRPKWWTFDLTVGFAPSVRQDAYLPIGRAIQSWGNVSPFNFSISQVYTNANFKISFVPKDGPGKILASGFAPRDGRLQFDQAENWVNGKVRYGYDIESVGLHELGHVLGLAHTDVKTAVMYPYFSTNFVKNQLQPDDIQGLRDLYNYKA
ncbi:putative peptidase M10A, Metallopeptidase, catalytic domain protein [Heracleum sosnowskyi]|uniref:Peptidase M10A, Metallopeptidase, catalytic domain protein n=1 Tax=Heracleum sosnowskyi TaxID=360622 RepID=A0AAD8IAZ9_9APIA|nr:putative peptidase M10A, Metallopeptidase, catalytic domain protein [Heracleum sosnowskyi]